MTSSHGHIIDGESDTDPYLSDSDSSLDLDEEIYSAPSMDRTGTDQWLNKLCDRDKMWTTFDEDSKDGSNDEFVSSEKTPSAKELNLNMQCRVHNPETDWNLMRPYLWEKYENPAQLKFCLTNYAVANGYQVWFPICDNIRLESRCGKEEEGSKCPFRLWGSWIGKQRTFQVKKLNEKHVCGRTYEFGSLVNPEWIAKHYVRDLIRKPNMSAADMKNDIHQKFLCDVSIMQCYRARTRALEMVEGKLRDHYAKLWDYGYEILRSNPGSSCEVGVHVNPDGNYFQRFYVCYHALKQGWIKGCRRVIGLDGCFLKGTVKGQLLSAIGRDANNHLYPIAWAVVDVENKANWRWFLLLLMEDIDFGTGIGLTIISDQHKGLIEAVKEVTPHAEHRQCARHVYANFRKTFTGLHFKNLFWKASKSTTEGEFKCHMEQIKLLSPEAFDYLMGKEPKTWCRAFFECDRACEAVENGLSESFNSIIVEARKKPIITMLEEIRIYVMERRFKMLRKAEHWESDMCPAILKKMKKWEINIRHWIVLPSGKNLYEVRNGFDSFRVDLETHHCSCRFWELSGIPCVHACSALHYTHQGPEERISDWFNKHKFIDAYADNIRPLNGSSMWVGTKCIKPLPPKARRMPGRPCLKRKRDISEKQDKYGGASTSRSQKICTNCFQEGHNKRTCKNKKETPPPKPLKKKGKPRVHEYGTQPTAPRGGRGWRGVRGGRGSTCRRVVQEENVSMSLNTDEKKYGTNETQMPVKIEVEDNVVETVMNTPTSYMQLAKDLKTAGYKQEEVEAVIQQLEMDNAQDGKGGAKKLVILE